MNTNNIRTCSALAAALLGAGASLAAEIHYAADDGGGVYCGVGYGISVNVPPDYDDVTIKYSENAIGPWRDSVLYTNVCMAKSVYFKIEAEGYDTVIDFRTVTITPKTLTSANVWIVLPTDDYVYDGTGKTPDVFFGDRAPAVLTRNDFDVSYASNTNAGTAVATFTGKGNYTGTVEEEFDILKAPFPGDGEEPGDGEVPGDGISKFDTTAIYDGLGHTIDTNALATAFRTVVGDDCVILYSVGEGLTSDLVWEPAIPVYTNAGEYVVFYCVQSENYEDFIHEAKMTITPRDVTLTSGSASKTYDGSPLTAQTVTVGGDGFVAGEGATYDVTGSQTLPGMSTNTFTYTLIAGTLADNYEITTVAGSLTVTPATIHYAADNGGGVYCGVGYGINVNVPPDYDDVTIKYSENAIGPWRDSVLYTNVCNATPVFFLIEADGYISVTNSRTVTVTPKTLTSANVWIVLPTDDYVYDGTGKTPDVYFGDRAPSVLTRDDFDVSYASNTNAGTAVATFTGKRNYTGEVTEEFDIGKAPLVIGAEAKTKVFGTGDPPLTYTNSALFGTDRITGALAREAGNAVGTYAILQGTLTAGENYEITYVGADLTILAPPNAIWYVDATNGVDTADGFSWATAKKTIQAALDLAEDGNQIIVTNGVYTKEGNTARAVVFNGRNVDVLIRSVNGPETTIIDGSGARRCVKMADDASSPSNFSFRFNLKGSIEGFTLQSGYDGNCGGASHALLRRCIIKNCKGATDSGGIVHCLAENCLIVDNSTDCNGNTSHPGGAARHSVLINCTVANNSNANLNNDPICPGGIANCVAINTILHGNTVAGEAKDVANVVATNSCFADAPDENGNIASDPLFVDAAHGDYRLSPASLCIDAGDSAFAPVGTDLVGNPRIVGNAVDMGCYECQSISLSSPSITVALDGGPFTYDGTAHEPAAAVTNGAVALVADRDYSVSYLDNVNAGTARAIVTGLGVYVGSRTNEFEIAKRPLAIAADPQTKRRGENDPPLTYTADPLIAGDSFSGNLERESGETNGVYAITIGSLTAGDNYEIAFTGASLTISDDVPQLPGATIRWKYAASVGRYFAQVSIPAQAGYSESLGNLAFLFADRKSADGTIYAQLWDLPSRGPCEVIVTDNGVEYRGVALDASAFAGKADGTPVVFGVSDDTFAESRNIVPSNERLIGLYVRKRVNPVSGNETDGEVENFIGYLSWTTGGTRYFLPVVEGAANGEVSTQARRSLGRTSSGFSFAVMPHAYEPATLGLSVSLGLDAVAVAHDNPQVRISAFEVGADGSVRGRVEAIAGGEASSSFGSSATVVVFASETPAGPWKEVHAEVDSAIGAFSLPAGTVTGHFFRAEVETKPIFE